jgi:tRNA threonylcarbamoyladenosine biosynthesis protein TsaE
MRSEPSADNRKPGSSDRVWQLALPSPRHTDRLGRAIGSALQGGESLALYGPLGSGKTALVRGIAAGLGASPNAVSSPTFVLLHEYRGRLPLAHVDLYRLRSRREVESIGLDDYLSGSTVVIIEWADKAPEILPPDRLEIQLRHRTVQSRSIKLMATGPLSAALLARTRTKRSSRRPRSGRPRSASAKGLSSR